MSFLNPPLIWFLIGLGLILMEFMVPGAILVFFGVGAWVAALTTWIGLTDSLAWQIIVFSVTSVAMLLLLRRRLRGQFLGHTGDQQDLEHDLEEFVGKVVSVTQAIRPGTNGRIELKGASWGASSDQSFEPGDRVVITGLDGIRVTVAAVDPVSAADQEAPS